MKIEDVSLAKMGHLFQTELSKLFANLNSQQREILSQLSGELQHKLKFPPLPTPKEKIDGFAIMNSSFVILAEHGWFIGLSQTPTEILFSAASCFLKRQIDNGNDIMVQHYNCFLDEVQSSLATAFPLRSKILSKAFESHRQKDYELSIPVMVVQAEGIFREILGDINPYSRNKKLKKGIKKKIDPLTWDCFKDYYSLLTLVLPINSTITNIRNEFPFLLNRHLILHGIDIDYANEIQALKAVSWLQYIASLK